MPITNTIAGAVLDDVYLIPATNPPAVQTVQTNVVGLVGPFLKGIPNAIYSISSYPQGVRMLGKSTPTSKGALSLQNLIKQNAGNIQVVPIFGTGAQAATLSLNDNSTTPQLVGTLTVAQQHPQTGLMANLLGTGPNAWSGTISSGSGTGQFNLTISTDAGSETFNNVTNTNWVQAINSGISGINNGNPSQFATAVAGTSSQVPASGTYMFSGGSQGTISDPAYVGGIDSQGNLTGMALLAVSNPPINIPVVAEYSSSVVNTALATFANTEDCMPCMCAPAGSTVATTITAKALISQSNVAFCDGWNTCYDADQQINVVCSPAVQVAGMAGALAPQQSWGNKNINGSLGLVTPRSNTDMATLQQAGVLCLCNNIPRGGFGTRSGISSDGVTDLYVTRMQYFLENSIEGSLGWAVDELQSTDANDELRKNVKSTIDAFLRTLMTNSVIDDFDSVCDLTNNTTSPNGGSIGQGYLYLQADILLLSAAKKIVIMANIGTTVTITSSVQNAA